MFSGSSKKSGKCVLEECEEIWKEKRGGRNLESRERDFGHGCPLREKKGFKGENPGIKEIL